MGWTFKHTDVFLFIDQGIYIARQIVSIRLPNPVGLYDCRAERLI